MVWNRSFALRSKVKHTLASMSHWMQPAVPENPSVKQTFINPDFPDRIAVCI